ncbi:MAG: caspase family protein, partial [Thiohalocapsa sp.]
LIPAQDGTAELIGVNGNGPGEPARFLVQWGGGSDAYKPRLFVLAVGVGAYPDKSLALDFAGGDARAVAEQAEAQRGGLYREVLVRLLPDAQATKKNVLDGLQWLRRQVGQRDVAAVFLAGHGVRDEYDDYFFLTHDADRLDPLGSALSNDEIRKFLRTVAGKTVLLLDTCYSGALRAGRGTPDSLPDIDRLANELADADSGVVVLASSTGKELSLEHPDWGHGAFTYALLEAIRDGKADYQRTGHVTIDELGLYVDQCVRKLTDGRQHPTMTKPKAVPNYPMFRVPGAAA